MKTNFLYFSILLFIVSCSKKEEITPQEVNETVFVDSFDDNLYALDAQTGKIKWAFDSKNDMYSPTVEGDKVYVHSGGQYKLYAINIADGSKKWEFDQYVFIRESPLVENGVIYTSIGGNFSLISRVYALDAETGIKKWDFKSSGWFDNSIVLNNGLIYSVGNVYTQLSGIDKMTGEIRWQHGDDRIYSSPFAASGLIYYGAKNKITILESNTGKVKKQIPIDSSAYFIPIINKNNFFVNVITIDLAVMT